MSERDEEWDGEPPMATCKICDEYDEIEQMIDCPKYVEDIEKGFVPGWIHESCCEGSFAEEASQCVEVCDNENLSRNIEKHLELCVDLDGLVEEEKNGVPVFMSQDRTLCVTRKMDEFLEPLKPLKVVTKIFVDKEKGAVYVRDNEKNTNIYPMRKFREIRKRFHSFKYAIRPEEFCIKDGPFFRVYRIGNVAIGSALAPIISHTHIVDKGVEVAKTYRKKYLKAEEFFGVALKPPTEELKAAVQGLSEDELISRVLCPLLTSLGFSGVKPISFHGPGESGGDFHPFYKVNEFGKIVYYSAQAKPVKIHSKAGGKGGNVNQLIDQTKKIFRTPFKSFIDNAEKRVSYAFIFSSQDITQEARDQLFHEIENSQNVSFIDIHDIVKAILDKGIAEEIIKYSMKKEISLNTKQSEHAQDGKT